MQWHLFAWLQKKWLHFCNHLECVRVERLSKLDEIFKNKVWLRYALNQIGDMEIPGISYQPCFNFRSMTPLFAIMSITKKTPLRFSDTHYLSSRAVGIREAWTLHPPHRVLKCCRSTREYVISLVASPLVTWQIHLCSCKSFAKIVPVPKNYIYSWVRLMYLHEKIK